MDEKIERGWFCPNCKKPSFSCEKIGNARKYGVGNVRCVECDHTFGLDNFNAEPSQFPPKQTLPTPIKNPMGQPQIKSASSNVLTGFFFAGVYLFPADGEAFLFDSPQALVTLVGPAGGGKTVLQRAILNTLVAIQSSTPGFPSFAVDEGPGECNSVAALRFSTPPPFDEDEGPLESTDSNVWCGLRRVSGSWSRFSVKDPSEFSVAAARKLFFEAEDFKLPALPKYVYVPQDHGNRRLDIRHWIKKLDPLGFAGSFIVEARTTNQNFAQLGETFRVGLKKISNLSWEENKSRWVHEGVFTNTEHLSAGQVDSLLTLWGLDDAEELAHQRNSVILLLDEPGQNLGASERRIMRRFLSEWLSKRAGRVQLILVTHHIELLHPHLCNGTKSLLHVNLRPPGPSRRPGTSISVINPPPLLMEPRLSHVLFAREVILIEGQTDEQFLEALDGILETKAEFRLALGIKHWDGFYWPIVEGGGHTAVSKVAETIDSLGIRYVTVRDFDVLFENRKPGEKTSGHSVIAQTSTDKSRYDLPFPNAFVRHLGVNLDNIGASPEKFVGVVQDLEHLGSLNRAELKVTLSKLQFKSEAKEGDEADQAALLQAAIQQDNLEHAVCVAHKAASGGLLQLDSGFQRTLLQYAARASLSNDKKKHLKCKRLLAEKTNWLKLVKGQQTNAVIKRWPPFVDVVGGLEISNRNFIWGPDVCDLEGLFFDKSRQPSSLIAPADHFHPVDHSVDACLAADIPVDVVHTEPIIDGNSGNSTTDQSELIIHGRSEKKKKERTKKRRGQKLRIMS